MSLDADFIEVGVVSGVYGVKGWVKVMSFTDPKHNILEYFPWYVKRGKNWRYAKVEHYKPHGQGFVVQFCNVLDRNEAENWKHSPIAIRRDQLPEVEQDEYYWIDLIGLKVLTIAGIELGKVARLIETGANDVLVVEQNLTASNNKKSHLIPYIRGQVIISIDLQQKQIVVDWDINWDQNA